MVERQVVALEVEGSSPSSYPIYSLQDQSITHINTLSNIRLLLLFNNKLITSTSSDYYDFILVSKQNNKRAKSPITRSRNINL